MLRVRQIVISLVMLTTVFITNAANKNRPNVVFILIDDLGWTDLSYMGSTYYESPNIDEFARKSLIFNNAYAGAANCAPSRACLISGMNSPRTGIYTVSPSTRGQGKTRKLIPIKNKEILEDDVFTMAEMFQDAGYVTGHFGKWHLGEDPCTQGFDVNVGGAIFGHPSSYFAPYKKPNIQAPEGENLTDRITKEALSFLEENKENPFFLYVPYYTVHTPLMGKKELTLKYKAKTKSKYHSNPKYAAMIENMDTNVGQILDKIDDLKLDNTIVVITSDNGGSLKVSKQYPLRSGKGSYYEGGIKVPMAVRWHKYIKPGTTNEIVNFLDFYPTFKELIGYDKEIKQPIDGVSLKQVLLESKSLAKRPLFYHFPIYLQSSLKKPGINRDVLFRTRPGTMVRYGDWKLLYYYEDKGIELFNLKNDPSETTDVSSSNPLVVKELKSMMDNWLKETEADIPTKMNPDYNENYEKELLSKLANK